MYIREEEAKDDCSIRSVGIAPRRLIDEGAHKGEEDAVILDAVSVSDAVKSAQLLPNMM